MLKENKSFKEKDGKRAQLLKYHQIHLGELGFEKTFHFLSRLFLWEKETEYLNQLKPLQKTFIGETSEDVLNNFEKTFSESFEYQEKMINGIEKRRGVVKRYPLLGVYNRILFQTLLSKTIYNFDVTGLISQVVEKEDIFRMRNELLEDNEALKVLSTHAINFLYFIQEIFGEEFVVDEESLYEIAIEGFGGEEEDLLLRIYFLTHCIIGESRFYSQKIKDEKGVYQKMIKLLEIIISENYFSISLDNKLEFLVCAKMCEVKTSLKKIIIDEAEKSFSKKGDYIVDRFNLREGLKTDFQASEHRNVLYLMITSKKYDKEKISNSCS